MGGDNGAGRGISSGARSDNDWEDDTCILDPIIILDYRGTSASMRPQRSIGKNPNKKSQKIGEGRGMAGNGWNKGQNIRATCITSGSARNVTSP